MKTETWYEIVFGMLTCLCPQSPDGVNFETEPQWVLNVWKQLIQQVMPTISLKPREITPRRLGRLLGQEEANWTAIVTTCAKNKAPENRDCEEAALKQLEPHRDNPAVAGVLEAAQFTENCLKSSIPLIRLRISITMDALMAAWHQPDERERIAFFQGIVEDLSKPGFPSRFTDATQIYQRLLVHRKEVEKFKSVRELREFLLKCGLTPQSLGEPKRLEKLCQRIGLSFSEPGRPKRTN